MDARVKPAHDEDGRQERQKSGHADATFSLIPPLGCRPNPLGAVLQTSFLLKNKGIGECFPERVWAAAHWRSQMLHLRARRFAPLTMVAYNTLVFLTLFSVSL
ncbi:MAG: hypothetical protein HQL37_10925 [Alphaproteobacteria bacterium]|nr:hypothetical protein [Alphaproteobacteria bacterium]